MEGGGRRKVFGILKEGGREAFGAGREKGAGRKPRRTSRAIVRIEPIQKISGETRLRRDTFQGNGIVIRINDTRNKVSHERGAATSGFRLNNISFGESYHACESRMIHYHGRETLFEDQFDIAMGRDTKMLNKMGYS